MDESVETKHSVETSIALLNAEIRANHAETNAKLDGIALLHSAQVTNLQKSLDTNIAAMSHRMGTMETSVTTLTTEMAEVKAKHAENGGRQQALYIGATGILASASTWLAQNWQIFFHR